MLLEMLSGAQSLPRGDKKVKRRLEQTLRRTHISKMESLGIVRYDAKQRIIALRELPSPVATQLESMLLLPFDVPRASRGA